MFLEVTIGFVKKTKELTVAGTVPDSDRIPFHRLSEK